MATASVSAMTDVGQRRPNNEDGVMVARASTGELVEAAEVGAIDLSNETLLVAVSDGMGGASAGEIASALTLDSVRARFARNSGGNVDVSLLLLAIRDAHDAVRRASLEDVGRTGMGATVVVAVVKNDRALVGLVGDSRGYLLRNGQLVRLTRDQTFVQSLLDAGALTREQAETSPHRSVILQSIGNGDMPEPAVLEFPLRRDDRLLVCSDGLTGELTDRELEKLMQAHGDPGETCRALVAAANANGGKDNISAAVVFVDGDDLPPPSRLDEIPEPPASGKFVSLA